MNLEDQKQRHKVPCTHTTTLCRKNVLLSKEYLTNMILFQGMITSKFVFPSVFRTVHGIMIVFRSMRDSETKYLCDGTMWPRRMFMGFR